MIIAFVPDVHIPETLLDETGVVVDVEIVRIEWDVGIIGIIVLDTTEPYVGISAVNLGELSSATAVGVAPNYATCYE